MTREEAIINLKLSQNRIGGIKKEEWNALQMAIEALSADTVSREFYEDAIKANHGLAKELANLKEEFESAEYEDYEHATLVDIKEPLKVLVVRCKDCRFYSNDHLCQQLSRFGSIEPLADFYCAFGKRREE